MFSEESNRLWLRMFVATSYDFEETLDRMDRYQDWYQHQFPIEFKSIEKALSTNYFYIGKRDKDFRPTVILSMNRIVPNVLNGTLTEKEVSDSVAFIVEFLKSELMIPG